MRSKLLGFLCLALVTLSTPTYLFSQTCPIVADFSFAQNTCNPLEMTFSYAGPAGLTVTWNIEGADHVVMPPGSITYTFPGYGTYAVLMKVDNGTCSKTVTKDILVQVTPADIIISGDSAVCGPQPRKLFTKPVLDFCWSPTTGLDDPTSPNPVATPAVTTTYNFTARVPNGTNLIVNGDFSAGNAGFTSDYTSNGYLEGMYGVGTDPSVWLPNAPACGDHTTGNGNMMYVNGATQTNVLVWSETVNVIPNTNYAFSAWLENITSVNPAQLQFSINGQLVGTPLVANVTDCIWDQFFTVWNSGTATTAVISIVNMNSVLSGNDFALDDISFAPVSLLRESVTITVNNLPVVKALPDSTICAGDPVHLRATGAATYTWTPAATLSDANIADPIAHPVAKTDFIVTGTSADGCKASDIATVDINLLPNADFSFTQNTCNPLEVTFSTGSQTTLTPTWNIEGVDQTVPLPGNIAHTFPGYGTYPVSMKVNDGTCPNTVKKDILVKLTPADIIVTKDTAVCGVQPRKLSTLPALSFCWSPTTGLDDPTSPNPVATPAATTKYYFTANVLKGENLIVNGDFSAGNTGFTSDYNYVTFSTAVAQYYVGPDPSAWLPNAPACGDHTTGTGNVMNVNGADQLNVLVWSETVNVTPNTNYAFSAWLENITSINPAKLQFSINGQTLGQPMLANVTDCIWDQFYTTWNSGSATTAVISIVNMNTILSGNDFALDDISFAPVSLLRDSVIVTVNSVPVVKALPDSTICAADAVQLRATGAATYAWTPAAVLSNAGIANPIGRPTVKTDFIVTGTSAEGCTATDIATVDVNLRPDIRITPDTGICEGSAAQLHIEGGASYKWTPAALLDDPVSPTPVAVLAKDTMFHVDITDANGCPEKDSVKVSIRKRPRFVQPLDLNVCEGGSGMLGRNDLLNYVYVWQPADGLSDPTASRPLITPITSAQYTVFISDSTCPQYNSSYLVNAIVIPTPVVTLTKDNDLDCAKTTTHLHATGADTYTWTPTFGISDTTVASPLISIDKTTTYIVKGTNIQGCMASDTVTVEVKAIGNDLFVVPNAFTPNGDGHNDCFGIGRWGSVQLLEFVIFNRWGERVFTTRNPGECWDGTFAGHQQPAGTFVYHIRAVTYCGYVDLKGTLILVR